MFDAIDLDGNGVLDAHEIRLVLRAIGEDDEDIITRIVASVDLNHDGGVSWGRVSRNHARFLVWCMTKMLLGQRTMMCMHTA